MIFNNLRYFSFTFLCGGGRCSGHVFVNRVDLGQHQHGEKARRLSSDKGSNKTGPDDIKGKETLRWRSERHL